MKRDVMEKLIAWKGKKNRKPLIVSGVRQCGKTYVIKKFGESEFENMAYFNFDGNTGLKSVFEYDFDVERIVDELESVILGKKIDVGNTLVVFDEIQDCPRAITSLKYFQENMPNLPIIAAGSLLGVALRGEGISFPVGKVDRITMHPMSFSEFVMADGGEKYIVGVKKYPLSRELPALYTKPLEKYLRTYYIIGGMPEVVQEWIDTHDYKKVEGVQDRILSDYADDFGKHAPLETAIKIRQIWDSVPVQIAKENNKFIFSHVRKGARAKELEDALQWLIGAGLVNKLCMAGTPQLPLSSMVDYTYFKVYMSDVGLLRRKSNINYKTLLAGGEDFIQFKGALTENYVFSELEKMGISCAFWRSKSEAEVDFITDYEGIITPIEAKSADNTKAKSLHLFCNRYHPPIAIKASLKNVGSNADGMTNVWSVPLYMLFRVKEYIEEVVIEV